MENQTKPSLEGEASEKQLQTFQLDGGGIL